MPIGATFLVLAVLSACVAIIPNMSIVALTAIFLGSFLAYLGFRSDRSGDAFEIIGLLTLMTFLHFFLGAYYLVSVPTALEQSALAPFLLPALMVVTLGYLALLLGYGWSFPNTLPSPIGRFEPTNLLFCLVPAALGSVGMAVARLQHEGFRNYGGVSVGLSFLQQFGSLFHFGWFLAWYMFWSKKLKTSTAVFLLTTLTAFAGVVLYYTLGSKSMAVILMAMPAVAYYQAKRRLPIKTTLAIVLISVFIVFPAYNTFRRVDRNLDTSRRLDRTVELAQNWGTSQFLDESVFAFLSRINIVTSVAAIVSDTGRWVDYAYGRTLLLAPIGLFIPRFVWPDKPSISIGREFGATFRFTGAFDRETYIAPSMVGELYWNFALPGVVIGSWLLGAAYRWYYQRYGAGSGYDPVRKAAYATLLPTALAVESNVALMIGGGVKTLVIIAVFVALSRRLGWLRLRTEG